jgi:hypothetical protein
MCGATRDVRFGPKADINDMSGYAAFAGERDGSGSAFASQIQRRVVRFGPIADVSGQYSSLVERFFSANSR